MKSSLFSPLSFKAYRRFYIGQLFSDLGNWIDFTILTVLIIYEWGLNESSMALFVIVYGLPWIVIGPFASVFVDRWSRKKVLMMTSFFRIFVIIGYIVAPHFYVLLILVFFKGLLASLFDPARQASIRSLVHESKLAQGITLTQISLNSMKIVGPSLGGVLVASFNSDIAFVIEAFCFVLTTIILIFVDIPEQRNLTKLNQFQNNKKFRKELQEGIKHIFNSPILSTAIISSALSLFIVFLCDGLFVILSKQIGFNQAGYGLIISLVGLGSVINSFVFGQLSLWKNKPLTVMAVNFFLTGITIMIMGLGGAHYLQLPSIIYYLCAFLLGALSSGQNLPYGYVLQIETPNEKMGRVSSVAQSLQMMMMLLAPSIGALMAKAFGVGHVFTLSGILCILAASAYLIFLRKNILEVQYDQRAKKQSV
ncbi:MFS transporter [Bacillus sp. WMMC1349]|uniref:MFS transporter n=1 Tax=Bacillus sp. WMMC1349 TaxID=2736254 RepID=UPI0015533231|nr:MFS transporter [Bacillus sp. WMMC1349]NPC93219.1 MFS transporter [Bacillus sp. WMMC1349]